MSEVRARIVFEGDATNLSKTIEKATDKVKELNRTAKEFSLAEAADQALRSMLQRQSVHQELIRRGVIEDSDRARAIRQERQAILERQSARQSLAITGLSMSGMGGAAGGYGRGLAIGSALDSAGYAGLARAAGPIGLAVGSSAMLAESMRKYERFSPSANYADPYLDPATRARGLIGALPGGETAIGYFDAFSGRSAGLERNKEQFDRIRTRTEFEGRYFQSASDIDRMQANAKAYQDAVARLPRPPGQTFDRSTAFGQQQQREADALLGPRTQAVLAERELRKATADRVFLEEKSQKLNEQRRINAIDIKSQEELTAKFVAHSSKEIANTAKNMSMVNTVFGVGAGALFPVGSAAFSSDMTVGTNNARGQLDVFLNRDLEIRRQQIQNEKDLKDAREKEALARNNKANADINLTREQLKNLQGQEQLGSNTAIRLGGLGAVGRAVGMTALEAVKKIGIDNSPSELVAQAESYSPNQIAQLREQAGIRFANTPEGSNLANEEFGVSQAANLKKLREQVNRGKENLPSQEQEADMELANAVKNGATALEGIKKLLGEDLPQLLQILDNKISLMRNGFGG